ncbi:MAG: FecR domain-containing protein [Campylobacteraceae bacterium]|nr:FecR domain-containing protein [Campylobacteraceae bacterium]
MKKIVILFLIFTSLLFAEVAKVVAIKGEAHIERGDSKITLELNSKLEKNDIIKTKEGTKLQIIFKDETIITIGKNSTFSVNEYVFDEQNKEYKAEFGLLKGAFRTITGKIGKIAPNKFKLKSKSSTIGIRGTQILSNMEISGDTIFCTEGTITIVSNITNEFITINAGQYVVVKKGKPMVAQEFEGKTIQETDGDTKFLKDEEKESALNDFGFRTVPEPDNTPPLEDPFKPKPPLPPHKVEVDNDISTNILIGDMLEFNTSDYTKGKIDDNTSTLSNSSNYSSYNLTLNNLSTNFNKDGSYSGTLSSTGEFLYNGTIHTFKNGTYTSKEDSSIPGHLISTLTYDKNDYVQWGEWNAEVSYESNTENITGYWLTGIQTPTSEVESLINSNANYSYSGYAIGKSSLNETIDANHSNVNFTIDFGDKSLTGSFTLRSFSTNISGTLSSSGFSFTPDTGTGSGSGKFFGPNAKSVGGTFYFTDNATYTGVFKATR